MDLATDLQKSGDLKAALALRFRAYALHPGNSTVLHSIAPIYQAAGDAKSATLCARGVVPECAEAQFFNAKASGIKYVSARRASNNKHYKIHSPEKRELPLPVSNADSRGRPEFRASHTESRGNFVSVLDNGSMWFDGFNTVIWDARKRIVKEHIKGNAVVVCDVVRQRTAKHLAGTVCFIDARSSSIYYHWMVDVLPKIALVKAAGIDVGSIDYFAVRCHSGFQIHTLEHLGIPMERVLSLASDQVLQADKLIVPYLKHDRGDRIYNGLGLGMGQWVPLWLSESFVSTATRKTPSSKLYISRAKNGTRTPENEARLVEELKQRGFQSVVLEEMSVVEQANLMATASVVVAPHGAGLTNIAFCNTGTMIVEIFGDYVVPCYWALSTLANLNYHHYLASEAATQPQSKAQSVRLQTTDKPPVKSAIYNKNIVDLASRRTLGIDLDIDDFVEKLDNWMSTAAAA